MHMPKYPIFLLILVCSLGWTCSSSSNKNKSSQPQDTSADTNSISKDSIQPTQSSGNLNQTTSATNSSASSNFLPPQSGRLETQFNISITWEKSYESSLRDVKPLRLDGFQGPALQELVSMNIPSDDMVFVQFPESEVENIFNQANIDRQNHQITDLDISWNISRAGVTFGSDDPVFYFTKSQFEDISKIKDSYLVVGSTSYYNSNEGLPSVYCIRSPQDELPFGPHSFDVLNEEYLILADPLKNRLVLLNNQGEIKLVYKLDFSPGYLQLKSSENKLEMMDEQMEEYYELDLSHFLGPVQKVSNTDHAQWQNIYKGQEQLDLNTRKQGTVVFQSGDNLPEDNVEFRVGSDQGIILSVNSLGRDQDNQKYILLHMERPDQSLYSLILRYNDSNESTGTLSFPHSPQVIYLENEFKIFNSRVYRLESKDQQYIISMYSFPN